MRQEGKVCAEKSMRRIRQKGNLLKIFYLFWVLGRVMSEAYWADWAVREGCGVRGMGLIGQIGEGKE